MDLANARRLAETLPPNALVIDVGGGASPFPRADYVLDAMPFTTLGTGSNGNVHKRLDLPPRYSRETWIQHDICSRERWPIEDKQFDYAVCSHTLEDIRDPIWVCSELQRIARAGYIEVPSRVEEQSLGVEHPRYAGYQHHRWLISRDDDGLAFVHKPHCLHAIRDAIVTAVPPGWRVNPRHAILVFEWTGAINAREVQHWTDDEIAGGLCDFAAQARTLPDLTVKVPMSLSQRAKRHVYFRRLASGRR